MSGDGVTVAGGSIAALVAADTAARRGAQVRLVLPEKGVGGGFQPLGVDGMQLEFGVRLLEVSYGSEDSPDYPDLREYRPGVSGHRPYISLVKRFLTSLLGSDLVEVDRPKMFVNGRLGDDIYFTVDLSGLRSMLTDDQARAIAMETRSLLDAGVDRAGVLGSASPSDLWSASLAEASQKNHGPTFHRLFIESVCRKIQAAGSTNVLAALRRKVWMPLYYPQTLWEACTDARLGFVPNRPFHTVVNGGTGEVVRRLVERVVANPAIAVSRVSKLTGIAASDDGTRLEFDGAPPLTAVRPILGFSAEQLFSAAGVPYAPERLPLGLCWVVVPEEDLTALPSMTFVADPELPAFRVNAGSDTAPPGMRLISIELCYDVPQEDAEGAARRTLEATGILRPGGAMRTVKAVRAPAFTAPTEANLSAFEEARELFNLEGLDAETIGGAGSFGADSLNEQIIQGLRAGEMVT